MLAGGKREVAGRVSSARYQCSEVQVPKWQWRIERKQGTTSLKIQEVFDSIKEGGDRKLRKGVAERRIEF